MFHCKFQNKNLYLPDDAKVLVEEYGREVAKNAEFEKRIIDLVFSKMANNYNFVSRDTYSELNRKHADLQRAYDKLSNDMCELLKDMKKFTEDEQNRPWWKFWS